MGRYARSRGSSAGLFCSIDVYLSCDDFRYFDDDYADGLGGGGEGVSNKRWGMVIKCFIDEGRGKSRLVVSCPVSREGLCVILTLVPTRVDIGSGIDQSVNGCNDQWT